MNSKIKSSISATAFLLLVCACGNDSTKTETTESDTSSVHGADTLGRSGRSETTTVSKDDLMGLMHGMMTKMEGVKITKDFDIDFANLMIEHHQGAIDMSNIQLAKGNDEKLKNMAKNIVSMQTEGIAKLRDFVQNYKPSGMVHGEGDLPKMVSDMKSRMANMNMSGAVDKDFANMMVSHHEDGIKMSKAQLSNGMSDKLKQIAKNSIAADTKDISEFKSWISANP